MFILTSKYNSIKMIFTFRNKSLFFLLLFLFAFDFFFRLLSFLIFSFSHFIENFSIAFTSFFKLNLKTFKISFRSKLCTKLFCLWFVIANIIGSPSPCILACFHLLKLTENLFGLNKMVHNTFMSFLSSYQCSD